MDEFDTLEETEQEEKIAIQKPKRQLTDKQKEATTANLAKGRAVRDEKRRARAEENNIKKEQDQARIEQIVVKKAVKMAAIQTKKENKLKRLIGDVPSDNDDNDVDIEERIFKKPKKKKIIYREESDSEEEVIIKKKRLPSVPPSPPLAAVAVPKRPPTILFY